MENEEKKHHIVYLTNEFITDREYKHVGGLATYLDNITSIMINKGHQVTVIVLSEKNEIFYYRETIRVILIKTKFQNEYVWLARRKSRKGALFQYLFDLFLTFMALVNSLQMYAALKKLLAKEPADIIHVASCRAVGFFRTYKVPTVLRASCDSAYWREACFPDFDYDRTIFIKNWMDKAELFCMRRADAAFAPSRCCANILAKRAGRPFSVIESPFRQHVIQTDDSVYKEQLRGKKYLLFNSTLSMLKGTHLGIRVAGRILEKYPDLYFVYAGTDNGIVPGQKAEDVLKEQSRRYQGRVIYLHKLDQEQLFPVIENSFACVLPSRIDNLPNSCIEAMALEKVVIGTYGASFEQLIKNKENGLLIQRDSVNALANAIDYLMQLTEWERLEMGRKAKKAIARLDPDIIYIQLMEYYETVMEDFKQKGNRRYSLK